MEGWARGQQEVNTEMAQAVDSPSASCSPESQVGHKTNEFQRLHAAVYGHRNSLITDGHFYVLGILCAI